MRGKKSWILILVSIGLFALIYLDAKNSNFLPPVTIFVVLVLLLIGAIGLKHAYRK